VEFRKVPDRTGTRPRGIGSLETGKWADFIVVDRDPFKIPPADLWKIKVEQTWVAGERVY